MIIKEYCGDLNIINEKPKKKHKPPEEHQKNETEKLSESIDKDQVRG